MIHSSDAAVMCVPRDKIMLQAIASAFCLPLIQMQTVLSTQTSDYFSNCPKFLLEPDEYEVLGDGTVSVLAYHRTYTLNQFRIRHDGRLEICTEGVEYVDKFNPSICYVTMAGLGVSVIFLALHTWQPFRQESGLLLYFPSCCVHRLHTGSVSGGKNPLLALPSCSVSE
jgi:hypothetical protein